MIRGNHTGLAAVGCALGPPLGPHYRGRQTLGGEGPSPCGRPAASSLQL